ncbi:LysR family transcriptional regulator [Nesterenkonia sp. MY13]|uniref:LysR family transcriptional regulator n=1 Tax=Nesterenkonia sedimenti TaxID=1463632 RepID=A0A7X8TJL1_9MICC|nr:LysR substrate-binding domain-containing protein [Nesterenkonia sedimenti]NLS09720.1 LysR family transcriptional regulator [Nesterenkonia sedimenti]
MTDIEVRLLRYFCAVYEERSFTRAARRLTMAQPPLSQAIATLERDLDVVLFERSTRHVLPTPAGRQLYEEAKVLLRRADQIPDLVRRAQDHPRRPLRIGAVSSTFTALLPLLLPTLEDFDVIVTDMGSEQQARALDRGDLDLALLRTWKDPDHNQMTFLDEALYIALPRDHPLADSEEMDLPQLRGEGVILFERARAPVAFDAIASVFSDAGVSPRPTAHVTSEQAMLGLVAAGLGFAVVTEVVAMSPWPGTKMVPLKGGGRTSPLCARVQREDPFALLPRLESIRPTVEQMLLRSRGGAS